MPPIDTSKYAKALYPGVRKWFGAEEKLLAEQYSKVFEQVDTKRAFEEEVEDGGLGLFVRKPEGTAITYASSKQGHIKTYRPVMYALGYTITFEAIINNLYKQLAQRRTKKLKRAMKQTRELIHALILIRAFDSNYATGPDSKELCATDHTYGSTGVTYSNEMAVPIALSELALEQAWIDIAAFTDAEGLLFAAEPEQLIIPPALMFKAARILESEKQSGNANNDANIIRTHNIFPKGMFVMNRLATGSSTRYFIKTNVPDGLKTFNRYTSPVEQDNVFDTKNISYACMDMYDAGWTDPHGIYGVAAA